MGPVARSYYLILLMVQWREGYIPDSHNTLRRLLTLPCDPLISVPRFPPDAGSDDDMDLLDYDAIIDQVLECFSPDGDGRLSNGKLKAIRNEQLRVIEAKSRGGKQSAKSLKRVSQESPNTVGQIKREIKIKTKIQDQKQKRGATPSRYSQDDFDERDSRRLADAKKVVSLRAQAAIGAGGCFTEAEFMTAICEESGLLPKRVKDLEEKSKWATTGASA
jgi:hypothetical protein